MMTAFLRFSVGALAAVLVSCAAPGGGGGAGPKADASSPGRSEYGNRPGPRGFRTVILDAGHGGQDSGAVSPWTRQKEKDAALDTVMRLRRELGGGFQVVLMRDGDYFVDLDDRVRRANTWPNAILVSVHYNSGGGGSRGTETFYWRTDSYSLARRIQRSLSAVVPSERGNRGLVRRRIRLTRNPEIPCVLVECGYLSNSGESRLIADSGHRQKLAHAIAGAIRAQAAEGDAGMGPLPPPIFAPMSRPTDPRE
ncbi:MAG: N-acetylmuramoyl-L-alanine amidase [Verrucomicrobiales bacterium]|nr:N-acetylmuramoyl-L-alanine amidase [Verrucomicrobiales bacterium]